MSELSKYRFMGLSGGYLSRVVLLVGMAIILAACGFHLRGQASLPAEIKSIYLLTEALDNKQAKLLRRKLQNAGASIQKSQGSEQVQLLVSIHAANVRNLVDAAGVGKTIVRIIRQLEYKLSTAGGEVVIKSATLEQRLDVELDDNNLLDKDERVRRGNESIDDALIGQLIFGLGQL